MMSNLRFLLFFPSFMPEYIEQLVIVGDTGVGKSSVLLRFTDGTFQEHASSIGVDFVSIFFKINCGHDLMEFDDRNIEL